MSDFLDLDHLYALDENVSVRKSLDYLYNTVDRVLWVEEDQSWPSLTWLFEMVDVDRISITLGVGILTITTRLKGRSNARSNFIHRFHVRLARTESPERIERLLSGLV